MLNTTVEVGGYKTKNSKDKVIHSIRLNRTHIVDAEAFPPDTAKGRAMVSITTIRDNRILWLDDEIDAQICVAECLPLESDNNQLSAEEPSDEETAS